MLSSQSNALEFTIDRIVEENSGQYVCEATNGFGSQRNELTVKVLSAPTIVVTPNKLILNEGAKEVLECVIDYKGHDKKCLISWIVDGKVVEQVMLNIF